MTSVSAEIKTKPNRKIKDTATAMTTHAVSNPVQFLPRYAILARYMLRRCVCPSTSVSLSVRHTSKFYQNGYTDSAYSWHEGILRRISYLYYYKKIRVSPKIRILRSGTLLRALDLKRFRHGTSIAATCCQLSPIKVDAQSAKRWAIVGRTTLTVLATVDGQFITLTAQLCPQRDAASWVDLHS